MTPGHTRCAHTPVQSEKMLVQGSRAHARKPPLSHSDTPTTSGSMCRLVELTLAWTACGDWGVEAISDVLKVNTVVTDLNLYHNDVGPRGASALARALRKNYTLHILNLDMNNIGDEGVQVCNLTFECLSVRPRVCLSMRKERSGQRRSD